MRIIGGKYRGKKLISPMSAAVRPTADKTREAIFNILRNRLGGDFGRLRLVDIFSGSGAFALEALSQGFGYVTMIDIAPADLLKNIRLFPAEAEKICVLTADACCLPPVDEKFDVLFMDAPYHQGLTEPALIEAEKILRTGALCLIEVEKNEDCRLPPAYEQVDERRYGLAKVIIAKFIL